MKFRGVSQEGVIVERQSFDNHENRYRIKYKSSEGKDVEMWCDESELEIKKC